MMGDIMVLNESNFDEVTAAGVVVVDFYADWCGPCKMMAPNFAEAKAEYEGRAVFAKVNVDESKEIAMKFSIRGIPTVIFFKDGKAAERLTGAAEKAKLCEMVDALL